MGSDDFNMDEFIGNLHKMKPPYICPITGCCKVYKSIPGFKYHLLKVDHDELATYDGDATQPTSRDDDEKHTADDQGKGRLYLKKYFSKE